MPSEQDMTQARAAICLGCERGDDTENVDGEDLCHFHGGLWLRCEADKHPKLTTRIAKLVADTREAAWNECIRIVADCKIHPVTEEDDYGNEAIDLAVKELRAAQAIQNAQAILHKKES